MVSLKEITVSSDELPSLVTRLLSTGVFDKNPSLWIKGGIAREALVRHCAALKGQQAELVAPRDVDLICESELSEEDVVALEATIGGKFDIRTHSVDEHLSFCDFTINEVVLRDGVLLCTEEAFKAAMDGVIRPTTAEIAHMDEKAAADEDGFSNTPPAAFNLVTRAAYFAARYGFIAERCWIYNPGGGVADSESWRLSQQARKAAGFGVLDEYLRLVEELSSDASYVAYNIYWDADVKALSEADLAVMAHFNVSVQSSELEDVE